MSSYRPSRILSTFLLIVLLMSMSFGTAYGVSNDWSAEMTRFHGPDRYATSALVSSYLFECSSDYVVIARGDAAGNYADALAGSYLAGYKEAPLLLTRPNELPASVQAEVERLGVKKAYILGGTTAIHTSVEDALRDMDLDVHRLQGANREETAVEIVTYVREKSVGSLRDTPNYAFIVNGKATADALVAGSYSYRYGIPILLVQTDSLPSSTGLALGNFNFTDLELIGGTSVISEGLETLLNADYGVNRRIYGSTRYDTSVEFAQIKFPNEEYFVFVAGPDSNLVDGISGAAFGLPILYTRPTAIPLALTNYLDTYLSAFSHLFILGGTNAISQEVADELKDIQESLPPMITYAYIEDDMANRIHAEIDNINNTVTLSIPSALSDALFTTGYSNLSKAVHLVISNTHEGKYDFPAPGRLIQPDDNFIDIIFTMFPSAGTDGVNAQTLVGNSGAIFTLTDAQDSGNIREYTVFVNIFDS
jgi:putative cell wall-binding protein